MKKIFLTIALLSVAVLQMAASVPVKAVMKDFSGIYNKYKDRPLVSAVYVSKSLLDIFQYAIENDTVANKFVVDEADLSPFIEAAGKLSCVYILSSDILNPATELMSDISNYINENRGRLQELMKQSDGVDDVTFYYDSPDKEHIKEFLMVRKTRAGYSDSFMSVTVIQLEAESLTLSDVIKMTVSVFNDKE
ncbi:MAG TPA: DUF4252 domain-containing protein [Candidatus Coprenecus pullistercoris]|nr:DUF4252 domain-containing protein [Candidatus Coprenecus pullistercoris]